MVAKPPSLKEPHLTLAFHTKVPLSGRDQFCEETDIRMREKGGWFTRNGTLGQHSITSAQEIFYNTGFSSAASGSPQVPNQEQKGTKNLKPLGYTECLIWSHGLTSTARCKSNCLLVKEQPHLLLSEPWKVYRVWNIPKKSLSNEEVEMKENENKS